MRKKLAEAQCKLVQSERLALIGEAIAAISHEARNELSGLSTGLALLPMILDDRDTVVEVIGHLRASEGRLHRLFEDVRSFAAPVQLQRAICDVNDLWRRAWSSLKPAWEKRDVSFGEELNGMPLELMGDAFRLEQVFRNLFENSLAACADPVAISISCSEAMGKKGWISLAVRDNGPGLNTEQKQKVFDAFFTTKASGTGLGMAIAKRIVEAHGGTITVGEEAIHGAEFVLALPMADGCLTPAE
jgi:signal transduction histidine kinase